MSFSLFCLVIVISCYEVFGEFNKDVVCILDKGAAEPVCKTKLRKNEAKDATNDISPIYDHYIPRSDVKLFSCSEVKCGMLKLNSISQITSPTINLQSCHLTAPETYKCERIRYNYFQNIDKLLFLRNNIPGDSFYMVDCLIYGKGERICHIKNNADSHAYLVDTGNIARPNETAILSKDELICQQSPSGAVRCDLNPYIPLTDGLKIKETPSIAPEILLKTGTYFVPLKMKCIQPWCGYVGKILKTRRSYPYRPPGGDIYRCYYAEKQQICKKISNIYEEQAAI